jgi:glycosyltransferase involved in cell wall biosynthesis
MFGWEFPPHISGGLGTACEGLTWALSKEGVEIVLVVPKLYGDEVAPFAMVNASEVRITPLAEILNGRGQLTVMPDNEDGNRRGRRADIQDMPHVSEPASNPGVGKHDASVLATGDDAVANDDVVASEDIAPFPSSATINSNTRKKTGLDEKERLQNHSNGSGAKYPRPSTFVSYDVGGKTFVEKIEVASPLLPYATLDVPRAEYSIYRDFSNAITSTTETNNHFSLNTKSSVQSPGRSDTAIQFAKRSDTATLFNLEQNPDALVPVHPTADPVQRVQAPTVIDQTVAEFDQATNQSDSHNPVFAGAIPFPVYKFSGRYDHDLLTEVQRFADVGVDVARTHNFDVIHAHDWMTFRAGVAARRLSGKPLVLHVHATEIDRSGANPDTRIFAIEKEYLQACDHVIAVSQWTKQILVKRYGIPESKITAIHNGIMSASPSEGNRQTGLLSSRIVSFVGRITYQKGPLYFVEAAFKVLEKFPNTHFVIAGSGDQLTRVIEQVSHLRMDSHFSFTGFLRGRDVDRLWSMTDVYVMPSVSEPFGITPLEAIRAGVPVIVSKQSGVSEVMPHALKVDFWDTDALADSICSILAYPAMASSMAQNARQSLKAVTWERAANRVMGVYDELLAETNGPFVKRKLV